jgi:hypothetical protein
MGAERSLSFNFFRQFVQKRNLLLLTFPEVIPVKICSEIPRLFIYI